MCPSLSSGVSAMMGPHPCQDHEEEPFNFRKMSLECIASTMATFAAGHLILALSPQNCTRRDLTRPEILKFSLGGGGGGGHAPRTACL